MANSKLTNRGWDDSISDFGQYWSIVSPTDNWLGIAVSADGRYQTAVTVAGISNIIFYFN